VCRVHGLGSGRSERVGLSSFEERLTTSLLTRLLVLLNGLVLGLRTEQLSRLIELGALLGKCFWVCTSRTSELEIRVSLY